MNLRSVLGGVRRGALCKFARRTVPINGQRPIVSFTFDDFPRSAYQVAGRVLESFGARGTYYVAAGLMNRCTELGELFQLEDLHKALDAGHELGTQTFGHSSCRNSPLQDFHRDVEHGITALEQIAGFRALNFAYPYGHVTLRGKRLLGPRLSSSRSIIPGLNTLEADLNLLRANRLYGDLDQFEAAARLIQDNVRRNSWLIFYTHDVRPNASEYGCTPALFEAVVACAAKSGSRILTIAQALGALQAPVQRTLAVSARAAIVRAGE